VLLVDDDEMVRGVTRMSLEKMGCRVLTAKDGVDGLNLFRQHLEKVDLVLLDMTMPRMSGEETFHQMRRLKSSVKVLLTSGYNEQESTNRFTGKGLAGFIQKPFTPSELAPQAASHPAGQVLASAGRREMVLRGQPDVNIFTGYFAGDCP